jgi:hypothetical protein
MLPVDGSPEPAWWPCDANGLKAGTPYQASSQRLDGDPTSWLNLPSLGFGSAINTLDWHCREGVVYHFDTQPFFRMPVAAPAAGSQVMCHGADSFSHIPARADGCLFKYRTYLTSDPTWPNTLPNTLQWDMSASRPDWWPCDASGQLRADAGMVAPAPAVADADCEGFDPYKVTDVPPPEGSAITCLSETAFTVVPAWSDACDPKQQVVTMFDDGMGRSSSGSTPVWWPCDADGSFIPTPHFTAAE